MTKKAWEIIIIIAGIVYETVVLLKNVVLNGGKHDDSGSGSSKAEQ